MTGPSFDGIGPFAPNLTRAELARRAALLRKAMGKSRTADPAWRLLVDCHNAKRRDDALRFLNGLGTVPIRRILWRYQELDGLSSERGAA